MAAEAAGRVVDADDHALEPADTWRKYLEPAYRDRAIRIDFDDDGFEVLVIDGRPLETLRGQLGSLGGIWASDYPHIDASLGVVREMREMRERLGPLPADARRKVLGDNAGRFYKLTG